MPEEGKHLRYFVIFDKLDAFGMCFPDLLFFLAGLHNSLNGIVVVLTVLQGLWINEHIDRLLRHLGHTRDARLIIDVSLLIIVLWIAPWSLLIILDHGAVSLPAATT